MTVALTVAVCVVDNTDGTKSIHWDNSGISKADKLRFFKRRNINGGYELFIFIFTGIRDVNDEQGGLGILL